MTVVAGAVTFRLETDFADTVEDCVAVRTVTPPFVDAVAVATWGADTVADAFGAETVEVFVVGFAETCTEPADGVGSLGVVTDGFETERTDFVTDDTVVFETDGTEGFGTAGADGVETDGSDGVEIEGVDGADGTEGTASLATSTTSVVVDGGVTGSSGVVTSPGAETGGTVVLPTDGVGTGAAGGTTFVGAVGPETETAWVVAAEVARIASFGIACDPPPRRTPPGGAVT